MTATDDFAQGDLGLISEGSPAGVFNQDGTAITKGAALVMEGSTDFRVQIADAASALNFIGIAATANKTSGGTAGDEIPVITRKKLVKVLIDGGSQDVAPGDLLVLDDDGSFVKLVALTADGTDTYNTVSTQATLDKIHSVCAIALQNHDNDGDSGIVCLI